MVQSHLKFNHIHSNSSFCTFVQPTLFCAEIQQKHRRGTDDVLPRLCWLREGRGYTTKRTGGAYAKVGCRISWCISYCIVLVPSLSSNLFLLLVSLLGILFSHSLAFHPVIFWRPLSFSLLQPVSLLITTMSSFSHMILRWSFRILSYSLVYHVPRFGPVLRDVLSKFLLLLSFQRASNVLVYHFLFNFISMLRNLCWRSSASLGITFESFASLLSRLPTMYSTCFYI